jgi:hypothetical protein
LRDIADYMVAQGTGLVDDGATRRQMMRTAEQMLRPFAEWIVASVMTKEAQYASSHVNIPLFCAWIEAYDWPDIRVGEFLAKGFASFGTLTDSGLFRPVCRPAAYTQEDLGRGRAERPATSETPTGKRPTKQHHPSYTFGERLRGRAVLHWCDNTVALSAAVGGRGNFPGCMRLVCMLHLALLRYNILVYFDWVPTDDNPADWPTRADKMHLIPPEAIEVPMRLPPSAYFTPLDGDGLALAAWKAALLRGRQ